jgi:hypothetical protein
MPCRGILLLLSALAACGRPAERRVPSTAPEAGAAKKAAAKKAGADQPPVRLELGWDPKTGKGDLRSYLASGDLLRVCFHCGFAGYTGGLVVGSLSGSGFGFYPRRPIRGFRAVNVFCAQDESIWDRDERVEYSYGWSENFGKGDDGKRLEYTRGRVIERGPERVVLQSENAGGCYRVTKLAAMERGARHLVIATRISNRCSRPVRFDLWSGDDPWLGLYASSDGDVGWTPELGLLQTERALPLGAFTAGGFYDLGNPALGQKHDAFSNQADAFVLDPAAPLPDLALFANRFAHAVREVDPGRPFDNKTMTALNLGWLDRTLAPGEGLTTAFALGLAETGEPGSTPRPPRVSLAEWSRWRRHLVEGRTRAAAGRVEFAAERVELRLEADALEVRGLYWLRNPEDASQTVQIEYPVLTAPDRPAPRALTLDGKALPLTPVDARRATASFPIAVAPRGLAFFEIRYRQPHRGRVAAYMVTSARSWPRATVGRAIFVIDHPAAMKLRVSYPSSVLRREKERITRLVALQPFVPERELELRW